MPTKLAVTEPEGNGIPLEAIRLVMDRLDRTVDVGVSGRLMRV